MSALAALKRWFGASAAPRREWQPSASRDVATGAHLESPRDVERLAREGFRSIVNLALEGEVGQKLSPNVEASWAHTFDLEHRRAPLGASSTHADLERALDAVRTAPKPSYVHSTRGRRAAAVAGLAQALASGADPQPHLEALATAGVPALPGTSAPPPPRDAVEPSGGLRTAPVPYEPAEHAAH